MIHTTMYTFPWDMIDEGVDRVAAYLKDDIGLDAISLSSVYHSCDALRTHLRGQNVLLTQTDAVYFQPDPELYRDAVLRPRVHPMAAERDIHGEIAAGCRRRSLGLIAWTVPLHNHLLADQNPDCAPLGAFGDRHPGSLCPANPHVREYVLALSRDLDRNHELEMIEYESLHYMPFDMFRYSRKVGVDLGALGQFLLSLCFCPACAQCGGDRGIDVGELGSRVRELLLDLFEAGPPELSLDDFVAAEPAFEAYVRVRADVVTSLVTEVREAIGTPISFLCMGDYLNNGIDRDAIERTVDYVHVLCYGNDLEEAGRTAREAAAAVSDPAMMICGLEGHHPLDSAELIHGILSAVYESGARRFSYYNYGMISHRNLGWIRDAIAAVREVDGRA